MRRYLKRLTAEGTLPVRNLLGIVAVAWGIARFPARPDIRHYPQELQTSTHASLLSFHNGRVSDQYRQRLTHCCFGKDKYLQHRGSPASRSRRRSYVRRGTNPDDATSKRPAPSGQEV